MSDTEIPDGWTLEQGRPAATAPYACHVLGGRLDETAGEWVMAVVSTPLVTPFTHWWPLPGATIARDTSRKRDSISYSDQIFADRLRVAARKADLPLIDRPCRAGCNNPECCPVKCCHPLPTSETDQLGGVGV